MPTTKLQLIGGGRMGQALAGGLIASGWAQPEELWVVEITSAQREDLRHRFTGIQISDQPRDGVDTLIAVKPHLVAEVCRQLSRPTRVISIAAGVTTEAIETNLEPSVPVVRVMSNTPSLVGAGAAAVAGGSSATEADLDWAAGILAAVGEVVVVPESQLDAVTGLSGSGPAYLFLVAEALTDAGVSAGLPSEVAARLAHQTLYGAAKLLIESGSHPAELRAGVTTPAGTTAAGLRVLEQRAVRAALIDAVHAASERSRQLGS